tara:strand:+ start:636 stop:854 length:219 start_codon:yes stop_codon:yes gene_type:complete
MEKNETKTGGLHSDYVKPKLKVKHPDAEQHLMLSMKKSIIRIVGLIVLPFSIWIGVILLIIAEGYGIKEELV